MLGGFGGPSGLSWFLSILYALLGTVSLYTSKLLLKTTVSQD